MLKGILAPVTTPFSESGDLLLEAFVRNLESYAKSSLKGILVGGTTGEGAHLSVAERKLLTEAALSVIPRDWSCLTGVGAASLRGVLEQLEALAQCRLDGVLVSVPSYYKSRVDETALQRFFEAAAEVSPFPVYLYNIPQLSGIELPASLIHQLARHPNIMGMKESSGNLIYVQSVLKVTRGSRFEVVSGSAETFALASRIGVSGAILAAACMLPQLADSVGRLAMAGDEQFAPAQARLFALSEVIRRFGVAGVKAGMDYVGLEGANCRNPLRPLTRDEKIAVEAIVEAAMAYEN